MGRTGRNARGEVSEQVILDATVALVSRYGFDNTTIARITEATGRPASSIYWLFGTKDDLIAAALESSYGGRPLPDPRPWAHFDPDRSRLDQMIDVLTPEMAVAESEAPLRIGIMLALEGSAQKPQVQAPFQARRGSARERILRWWGDALSTAGLKVAIPDSTAAQRLTSWTMAFLDGHYVSDVTVSDDAAGPRAHVLAQFLEATFLRVLADPDAVGGSPTALASPRTTQPLPANSDENLLKVTRALIALRGYEGATIGRISKQTGLTRSSLYWRYKDKDALVEAAVAGPFIALMAPLESLPTPSPDWAQHLASALGETLATVRVSPNTTKSGLLLKVQRQDPPTSAGQAILDAAVRLERNLAAWLSDAWHSPAGDEHAAHVAWAVTRLLDGLMLGSAFGDSLDIPAGQATFQGMLESVHAALASA
ncbi:MAG: TetR/AcrR family transcriptional regulator [Dermatophilus congolensis]|nr:TetR/AcrR family transcriptional regulator [Dermatophilus congolensis]